jgi:hypothetical protein
MRSCKNGVNRWHGREYGVQDVQFLMLGKREMLMSSAFFWQHFCLVWKSENMFAIIHTKRTYFVAIPKFNNIRYMFLQKRAKVLKNLWQETGLENID